MTLLESHQVASLVVGLAVDPAAVEDSDPLEGKRTEGCLMLHPTSPAAPIESLSPEGARDGLAHPFDKGLAQEGGTRVAPVDPRLVAASFRDRKTYPASQWRRRHADAQTARVADVHSPPS